MASDDKPIRPMTLGRMRRHGVRGLFGPRRVWHTTGRSLGLRLVGRRLFELLSQFLVFHSQIENPLLGFWVVEGLGSGSDFFGASFTSARSPRPGREACA
jgi:hypothetical protein